MICTLKINIGKVSTFSNKKNINSHQASYNGNIFPEPLVFSVNFAVCCLQRLSTLQQGHLGCAFQWSLSSPEPVLRSSLGVCYGGLRHSEEVTHWFWVQAASNLLAPILEKKGKEKHMSPSHPMTFAQLSHKYSNKPIIFYLYKENQGDGESHKMKYVISYVARLINGEVTANLFSPSNFARQDSLCLCPLRQGKEVGLGMETTIREKVNSPGT